MFGSRIITRGLVRISPRTNSVSVLRVSVEDALKYGYTRPKSCCFFFEEVRMRVFILFLDQFARIYCSIVMFTGIMAGSWG